MTKNNHGKISDWQRNQAKTQGLGYLMNTEKNKTDKLVTQNGPKPNYLTVFCSSYARIWVFGGKRQKKVGKKKRQEHLAAT